MANNWLHFLHPLASLFIDYYAIARESKLDCFPLPKKVED